MENKNKIYFSSVQYESNKWLVRFKKCVLLSVRLHVFSEASGSFAVEIIAFKYCLHAIDWIVQQNQPCLGLDWKQK